MNSHQLITTSVYRRLAQVMLSLVLLILILYKWVNADFQASDTIDENTKVLIDKLIYHSATRASHLMGKKQRPQLKQLLIDLYNDPHIEQAIVYNQHGKIIATSPGAITAYQRHQQSQYPPDAYTPINATERPETAKSIMVVQQITEDKKLLGYLSVNYYHHLIVAQSKPQQLQMMEQVLLMVLLATVMGFLLTRGFARFSRNTFRVSKLDS